MSNSRPPDSNQQAYTGETIVMPKQGPRGAPPVRLPRPARRRAWPLIRAILLVIVGLMLLLALLLYLQVRGLAAQIVISDARPNAPVFSSLLNGANVLVVGVDERPGAPEEGVRSDTLLVAHVSAGRRWVNLLSIPRDSLVSLPDIGETKINVAYGQGYARAEELFGTGTTPQQGGMALSAQTVEQFLDLPARGQRIDYVAQINFDGFAHIIDALGGITIDVPKYILDEEYPTEDFQTMRVEFQPGVQRMDGKTALIYARTRHADSDFDRGVRQQQVVRAIMTELQDRGALGIALLLPKLRDGLAGAVATTMPIARLDVLAELAWLISGFNADELGQVRLSPEIDPQMQEIGSDLIWSQQGIAAAVDALLTRPSEASEAATVQVLNGTTVSGLAGRVSAQLDQTGFTIIPAGNAPSGGVERTVVYDLNNKPRTSRRLVELLGAELQPGPLPDGVVSRADIVVILGADAANKS